MLKSKVKRFESKFESKFLLRTAVLEILLQKFQEMLSVKAKLSVCDLHQSGEKTTAKFRSEYGKILADLAGTQSKSRTQNQETKRQENPMNTPYGP